MKTMEKNDKTPNQKDTKDKQSAKPSGVIDAAETAARGDFLDIPAYICKCGEESPS